MGEKNHFYGKKHTKESKELNRQAHLGKTYCQHKKREPLTEQHKDNIRKSMLGKNIGEDNPNWRDGVSFEIYPIDWTDIFKESIRKRDNHICQECGINQDELTGYLKRLDVHHIDYNKKNLNPNNLITLCRGCHIKTNYNREYWLEYFKKIWQNAPYK